MTADCLHGVTTDSVGVYRSHPDRRNAVAGLLLRRLHAFWANHAAITQRQARRVTSVPNAP